MRRLTLSITMLAMLASVPATAKGHDGDHGKRNDHHGRHVVKHDDREHGFDAERARQAYQEDRRDWQNSKKRAQQEQRADARNWQRGQRYAWNHPDPRYNGYYANNYYRAGNYRPYQMQTGDRIYRGSDNRYYCRRSDGSTGLIIGAIGGGVLGNAIAPGGSRTLGAILGGSLGAILGSSIDRGSVTCR